MQNEEPVAGSLMGRERKISMNELRKKSSTHLAIAFGLDELTPAHFKLMGS